MLGLEPCVCRQWDPSQSPAALISLLLVSALTGGYYPHFTDDKTKSPRNHMPEPRAPGSEVTEGFRPALVSLRPTASPHTCCSLCWECSSHGQLLLQPNGHLLKEALTICSSHLLLLTVTLVPSFPSQAMGHSDVTSCLPVHGSLGNPSMLS